MKRQWLTLGVLALVGVLPAQAQTPPCDPKADGVRETPGISKTNFVDVVGPANARCNLERVTRQQYREPTDEERAMLRDGQLLVIARTIPPRVSPYQGVQLPPSVTQIVLKAGSVVVTPSEFTPVPQPWTNAAGAQLQSFGADAWFPMDQVPDGPFSVVLVTQNGEQEYKIKQKDRAKIR